MPKIEEFYHIFVFEDKPLFLRSPLLLSSDRLRQIVYSFSE